MNFKSIFKRTESKNVAEDLKKFEAGKIIFPIYERVPEKYESRYFYSDKKKYYLKKGHKETNVATIMCAGDLMCEPAMSKAMMFNGKFFFEHGFEKIRNVLLSSDFAIANLETTVTSKVPYAYETHKLEGRYHCNAPVEYLDGLRYAGFDAFAQANNHNADAGADGIIDTVKNVESKGFLHTGLFTSENDQRFIAVNINGIKVAILSYTEHVNRDLDKRILNVLGQNTLINRYSPEKLIRDIKSAKDEGAEFILVYIHSKCKEYSSDVIEHQETVAKEMAELGVDCILGSHSHSLQRYDEIFVNNRRVPVIYSLGNFMTSDATSMITRKSIIYVLTLRKENGKVSIKSEHCVPCRVIEGVGRSSYDVWPTPKEWTDNVERKLLKEAEQEIISVIGEKLPIYKKESV